MTRYPIETKDRLFVKRYGFFSFTKTERKNLAKNICKM